MGTLKGLATRLNDKADKLDEDASKLAVKVAETVVASLAYDTPVDVSTALSNWQVSVGTPVVADRAAFYPGEKGSTYKQSASAAIDAARVRLAAKKPGETIYISNLLPYIRKLNGGSSKQHPGNFVEAAVIRGRDYLRKLRNK